MLKREQAPPIRDIAHIHLPPAQVHALDNGIPVYEINAGTQDVLKLEIVFHAGRPFEQKQLVARATARLLREGTHHHNAAQIAETIDFYGGSLSSPVNLDTSNITLYCLSKHFEQLLPLIREMLTEPAFTEEELQTFISNNQQRLQVELSKNDVLAYRLITEKIFGAVHPYGYNSFPDTYGQLKREDLLQHYQELYTTGNCSIFVSGKTGANVLSLLNHFLGQHIKKGPRAKPYLGQPAGVEANQLKIDNPGTVQTAIRIGRLLFNRQHPDFMGMYVLNTVLGGYFGSRLMANIREDKGYTYNIYSMVDAMRYHGYFYIGTEVGNAFVESTMKEIYLELDRLQQDLISPQELQMVRNYLLGHSLTMLDGAFNVADIIRTMVLDDVPFSHFKQQIEMIRSISAEDLRELARRYLRRDQMWEVVVGS
ncbi:MAG: pitrilysin family protein [Bacteroidota bacterium]